MRRIFTSLLVLGWSAGTLFSADLQEQLATESQKRAQMIQPLQRALSQGEQSAAQGETLRAWQELTQVWQQTPESLQNTPVGHQVLQKLALWEVKMAEAEAGKSQWPKARDWALLSLQHDPRNERASSLLEKANAILQRGAVAGEETNPALTGPFFSKLQGVRNGLKEAEQLRETGQLDLAETRFEEVLKLDPFNTVATEGIRKIYSERALVAAQSRDLSNLQRRREVREAWNNIYPKKAGAVGGSQIAGPLTASATFLLEQKLREIRIPQIDFSGADLETIRRALNTLSRQYDTDAGKAGVNFVVSADVTSSQPVNLKLRNVALGEVVKYVAQIAGVKSRLSEVGVTFSPLVETRPDLIPREFTVSPSFFKQSAASSEGAGAGPRGGGGGMGEGTEGSGQSETAKAKLEELGVVFPPGGFAVYNPNTSRLKVVNNAEMLDLIGQLIGAAEEQTLLIQVGVRLVEINQTDLDSVTANSTLGGSALPVIPAGLTTNNQGPIPVTGSGWNAQLNQIQGVGLLPNNTLQSFLQTGVLAGTNQASSYALNTMELGGTILNGMQFRTLITAISQKSSANVLANPSIILKRGQTGVIEISQEFRYVQEYNDPQSSIRTIIPPGGGAFNTGVPGPETVIGSFPSQISDPVPIGVKIGIEPDITGDNSRVLLRKIEPSFVDFDGYINYGTQINSAYAAAYFSNSVTILTNNIQQPVFVRRDLTLPAIEVSDGHTLMLGGLLREDIQKIDEKVPIIGDIPIFGRAFQGKTEQAIKKNTLIFVTPRILQVDGQPLNPTAGAATTAGASATP